MTSKNLFCKSFVICPSLMMLNSKKVVMTRTDPYRCAFFLSGFFQYYFSFPQYYGIKVQEDFVEED